ncbi:hypothetical protein [Methylobacterium sp. ID0610]|uniref:hypothetical protein n=1 Tax=Methylobacterium carpenticola TaxID=3344827 RepID=UPI0036974E92
MSLSPERPNGRVHAWEAMRVWFVNERRALCDHKADLLASTASAFLLEHPNGDTESDAFVAYALAHLPLGGGKIGKELRADIIAEAIARRLI